jgi:hypothetical protein
MALERSSWTGWLCVMTVLVTAAAAAAQERSGWSMITMQSLIEEMTDLANLARYPSPEFKTLQFSSYDRASTTPDDPQTWFANRDHGQFIRTEQNNGRTEYVMMDAEGPGAVVRIWTANPKGTVRIYLDGQEAPVIEEPMERLLNGTHPLLPEPVAGVRAQGYNLYIPIPFAEHCKITSDAEDFYYLINYRQYGDDVQVRSFDMGQLEAAQAEVQRLAARLGEPRGAGAIEPEQIQPLEADLEPGARAVLLEQSGGPRAVVRLVVRPEAGDMEQALRGVVLRAWFDDEQTIDVPLGDFFGAGPGVHPFESVPMGHVLTDGGAELWSQWVMPFERSVRMELHNLGSEPLRLTGEIGLAAWEWDERSMHLHAGFRSEFDLRTRPMQDWNYLTAEGRGVFAGVSFTLDNPSRIWWGEGDEKIYIDGEDFPSWFGTGTEDYFGYAWCSPELFTHAYHNQPRCDGPGNYGRTSVNRFHIIDSIPFEESLRFDMEIWHWRDVEINAAVTTWWYGRPGARADYAPLGAEDVQVRPMEPYVIPKVAGAIEGEEMEVLEAPRHTQIGPQEWQRTSGEHHLWWRHRPRPGDRLRLGFEVAEAGEYRVYGRFLRASDYGMFRLEINGKDIGWPLDLHADQVRVSEEIDLGVHELKAGRNELTVIVTGAAAGERPNMFGLDYLLLRNPDEHPPGAQVSAGPFRQIYDPGAGEAEPWYINDHCFIRGRDGMWHLFGITRQEPARALEEIHLAHATADELTQRQWEKQPFALTADFENHGEVHLWAPHVIEHDGLYYMFYCAGAAKGERSQIDGENYRIHLATSSDLRHWTRHAANPLFVDGWDGRDPMVIRVGDPSHAQEWVMYYTATSEPSGGNHVVAYRTSEDLIHWSERGIAFTDPSRGRWGGPTESPFVVRRGEWYYLFIGPRQGYVGTDVFRSQDPLHFELTDKVGHIPSHAAEVVRDVDGAWYVSHCGWGQGGVYVAELRWNDGRDDAETSLPVP